MWRDVRFAIRSMRKSMPFTLTTLLLLTLGVGAATCMFSVVDTVLLRPLPFPDAQQLVQVWDVPGTDASERSVVSARDFDDLRRSATTVAPTAVYSYTALSLQGPEGARRIIAADVSHEFLTVLRVPPRTGRDMRAEDDRPGAPRVAAISHALAASLGPDGLPGNTIRLSGDTHEIIGVMPDGFGFPSSRIDLWRPLAVDYANAARGMRWLFMIGRLQPHSGLAAAREEFNALGRRLALGGPEANTGRGFALIPLHDEIAGDMEPVLRVLFAAALLVLVAVAANLAALFIARNAEREHELAVRKALGASTAALVRYSLAEVLLLAGTGSALGLLVASWGLDAVRVYAPRLPRIDELSLAPVAFAFAVAAALAVSVMAQTHVLVRLGRVAPLGARRASSAPRVALRWRSALLAVQTALATVLLVGSALLVLSAARLENVDPGFDPRGVLTARISLSAQHYATGARAADAIGAIVERLAGSPGVQTAAAVTDLPFSGSRSTAGLRIDGRPPDVPGDEPSADLRAITPRYFSAMGIPVLEGRAFASADDARGPRVAIVNRTMARRYWPNDSAIGKRIRIGHSGEVGLFGGPVWREVVGVIGDIRHDDLTRVSAAEIYLPLAQSPAAHVAFVMRTRGSATALAAPVRAAVAEIEPREALYDLRTMEERLAAFTAPARFRAVLLAAFAVIGLLLAAVGTYGAVTYAVSQREREFALRIALGASARRLVVALSASAARIGAAGIAAGLAGAFVLRSFVAALLFDVDTLHPPSLAAAAVLVAVATAIAWWVPARRVCRIDPAAVLQRDA